MKIVVTEEIETVGWDEAMAEAPKAISDGLRAGSKAGLPICCGQLITATGQPRTWVVVSYAAGSPIVLDRVVSPIVS